MTQRLFRALRRSLPCGVLAAAVLTAAAGRAATVDTVPLKAPLPKDARLAIWGDSITESTLYPKLVEAYLLACAGRTDITVCVFGHSGETLGGPLSRSSDMNAFKPTAATIFYGMNDTGYSPYTPDKSAAYNKTMLAVIDLLKQRGIENRVIVGPTIVDDTYCRNDPKSFFRGLAPKGMTAAQAQNITLGHFHDIARADALAHGCAYADVYDRMIDAYAAAQKALGPQYEFAANGGGIHPGPNGQMMIAGELLKALACDGDIGTIDVDLAGGTTATAGHKVISAAHGVIKLESTRYPFCVNYDRYANAQAESAASIMPFLPFQQGLNRFVLKVTHLDAASANVTWGDATKIFSRGQLEKGINLAAEFPYTPFDTQFAHLLRVIGEKQDFENYMIKGTSNYFGNDAGGNIDANMLQVERVQAVHVKIAAAIPVRYTIVIEPTGTPLTGAPVISQPGRIFGAVNVPLNVPLTVLHGPAHFSATGLPDGVTIDAATGTLSGRPTANGLSDIVVSATNAHGTGEAELNMSIDRPALGLPEITSPATATATVGQPFAYQITATHTPLVFFVSVQGDKGTAPPQSSLPAGLTYDTKSGLFSGTPQKPGQYAVQLAAWNGETVGEKLITLTVKDK